MFKQREIRNYTQGNDALHSVPWRFNYVIICVHMVTVGTAL